MTKEVWRTVVRTLPRVTERGPVFFGDHVPVVLDCGHSYRGNPTMMHKAGERHRCHDCEATPCAS